MIPDTLLLLLLLLALITENVRLAAVTEEVFSSDTKANY
jgi:hypothetical protein